MIRAEDRHEMNIKPDIPTNKASAMSELRMRSDIKMSYVVEADPRRNGTPLSPFDNDFVIHRPIDNTPFSIVAHG